MKRLWYIWSIVGVVLFMATVTAIAYANGGQNITSTINTARFILFGGSYKTTEAVTEDGVFKLDTYSGDTWILRVIIDNGKRIERWEPVSDNVPPVIRSSSNVTIPGNPTVK